MQTCILILWGAICITSVFAVSTLFVDPQTLPKWISFFYCLVLLYVVCAVYWLQTNSSNVFKWNKFFYVVSFTCLLQALYGILQYLNLFSAYNGFDVTGSFDNPTGFAACLVAGLPFWYFFIKKANNHWVLVFIFIVILAIILSKSRAGIFSCIILIALFLLKRLSLLWRFILASIIISLFIIVVAVYKSDSSMGRIFIWRCAMQMFLEQPLLGHGINAFYQDYMDYQASYFATHPDSDYVLLADNIKHAYNEYLLICIQWGILGCIVLISTIITLYSCARKFPSLENRIASFSLIGIAVYSCFSYPFAYPFVWLICILDIVILLSHLNLWAKIKILFNKKFARVLFYMVISISALLGLYKLTFRVMAEIEWNKISKEIVWDPSEETFIRYHSLMNVLDKEFCFLYNYAAELYFAGYYKESYNKALMCTTLRSDYDLELLLGLITKKMGLWKESENYFQTASNMCPNRFIPLYHLALLYRELGDLDNFTIVAQQIINKPVKIPSFTVIRIRSKIEKLLTETRNKN